MDAMQISQLNHGTGSKIYGMSIFAACLIDIIQFFGDDGWNERQILQSAEIFFDECYWFSMPELKHFAKRAKSLKFGKMYGKFTPAMFMEWMALYSTEAFEKRSGFYAHQTTSTWVEPENPIDNDRLKGLVSDLQTRLLVQKADEAIEHTKRRLESMEKQKKMMQDIAELKNEA